MYKVGEIRKCTEWPLTELGHLTGKTTLYFFYLNFDLFIEVFNKQTNCILMITSNSALCCSGRQEQKNIKNYRWINLLVSTVQVWTPLKTHTLTYLSKLIEPKSKRLWNSCGYWWIIVSAGWFCIGAKASRTFARSVTRGWPRQDNARENELCLLTYVDIRDIYYLKWSCI